MRDHGLKYLFVVFVALLTACANIGNPDGGPYDEEAPKIVGTSPAYGAVNARHRKIVLMFDENIKLDNPTEKVVISPPQINQPEIDAMGKRITIELKDSLKPGMTYTIDFADAIQDNNEGNPMPDYAFTFSTGETVDTFQVSGYVLDASNLEPVKGMLVGLYRIPADSADIPDSLFTTRELERVSRTDATGHFIIKGLSEEERYRVFAVKDMNQDFMFSQKAEMIAFNRQIITPSARPDIRMDTVWHDSIHYDSIVSTPYTHFYPDDIVLMAFTEAGQNRAFLKSERPQLERFSLFFTAPDTALPVIRGLNFNEEGAFVVDANQRLDSITYWVRDSMVYNKDTLSFLMTYNYTDTLNQLVSKTDTMNVLSKVSYEKVQKRKKSEWEEYRKQYIKEYKQNLRRRKSEDKDSQPEVAGTDSLDSAGKDGLEVKSKEGKGKDKKKKGIDDDEIDVPPMPETFLDVRFSNTNIGPDQNIDITFKEPIDTAFVDKLRFYQIIDSVDYDRPFLLRRIPGKVMQYRLYAEWQPDSTYYLQVDTGAFVNIYGTRIAGVKKTIKVKGLDKFSQLSVNLKNAGDHAVVSLLNQSGKEVKRQKAEKGKVDFFYVDPGSYYLSMLDDRNGDGEWTTGEYESQTQPEETWFYPGVLNLRAQWEVSQDWDVKATPLFKQKPEKITKQKPEKKKDKKGKNAEREKNKRK